MPSLVSRRFLAFLSAVALTSAACGDDGLGEASIPNVVDTVTIGALVGTPISVPSGFSVTAFQARGGAVRTDQTSMFDFAFNIDGGGRPVFLPVAVLGLGSNTAVEPGLQTSTLAFGDILQAPNGSYVSEDTVHFAVGDRLVIRSRVCFLGVPQYGKMEILALDADARTVTFRFLTNNNCGYKNLIPGIPSE